MGGFSQRCTWRRVIPAAALVLSWVGPAWSTETILQPTGDVWIRETSPGTTYENDLVSVWSNQADPTTAGRRYGVVEYDLAPLAGKTIATAELRMFAITGGTQATRPMKQAVFNLPSGATPVTQMTWTAFMAERDAGKTPFETLGRVDLPPINSDPNQQNQYVITKASAADIQVISSELTGDGKLTVAFIADEDGTSYKRDWGDTGYAPYKPPLLVVDDSDCYILTTSLPETYVGDAYATTLETTGTCPDPQWSIVAGALPPGLELHPTTGIISGTPTVTGESPFTVQMVSSTTTRTRDFKILVKGDTVVEVPASTDVWIRQIGPSATFENDLISVWSFPNDRRYGIVEFDVSSLAGSTLQGAALRLWSTESRSTKQSAFLIASDGTPVAATTWTTYMAEKDATKQAFSRFGRYELLGSTIGVYLNSASADQADLNLIQGEINGDGKLTLVLIADSDASYRRDWGDSPAHPPVLALDVGSSCVIVTASLPAGRQGAHYSAQLQASAGCGGQPTWQQPDCFPAGLTLDPLTGLISGWPQHRGLHEFVVTLLPQGGGATRQAKLSIDVAGSPADLDNDGDVDSDDFAAFNAAYTGPVSPPACELSADDPLPGIAAAADVWIRETRPDQTYESDLISVWSNQVDEGATGRRYGVVEFDVSAYAGQTLSGAAISLYRNPSGSQQYYPIKQKSYLVDCAAGELAGLNWNSYMAGKDSGKVPLQGLGSMEMVSLQGLGVYTMGAEATAADIALIQAEANGDGRLSIVIIPEEDGTGYRADWGDGNNVAPGYASSPPILHLFTGQCGIMTMGLPSGVAGTPYSATLQATPGCAGGQWQVSQCALPPGLHLNAATGEISGTPLAAGTWPFQVQLGANGLKRNLVIPVGAGAKADFDQDGDVDLIDFDTFALAFTGLVGPPPLCGTLEFHSTTTPVSVPDGGSVANTITVPAGVTIADVNVFVDVTHGFEGDVKVVLTSPSGTNVLLQDFSTTIGTPFSPRTYDDEGAPHPVQPLLNLDGQNAAGTWTLRVYDYDTSFMDYATLNSWKLIITLP